MNSSFCPCSSISCVQENSPTTISSEKSIALSNMLYITSIDVSKALPGRFSIKTHVYDYPRKIRTCRTLTLERDSGSQSDGSTQIRTCDDVLSCLEGRKLVSWLSRRVLPLSERCVERLPLEELQITPSFCIRSESEFFLL